MAINYGNLIGDIGAAVGGILNSGGAKVTFAPISEAAPAASAAGLPAGTIPAQYLPSITPAGAPPGGGVNWLVLIGAAVLLIFFVVAFMRKKRG